MSRPHDYTPLEVRKQDALDALDRLLGNQNCTKAEKAGALHEVSKAAFMMSQGIKQRIRDAERKEAIQWNEEPQG